MTRNKAVLLLVYMLVLVFLLTCCVEITLQQPGEGDGPEPHGEQAESDFQASLTEDHEITEPVKSEVPDLSAGDDKAAVSDGSWSEYTARDMGLSFRYPMGWNVEVGEAVVSIDNAMTNEQLMMVMIPFDKDKDPTALAVDFITLLQMNNPNVDASNWRWDPQNEDSQVVFDLTDEIGGDKYSGTGIVMKDSEQAVWFSYIAPDSAYSYDNGIELLLGFIESLASVSESDDASIAYDSDLASQIDANARGFMFVLEFALGAPFTSDQEQVILDELKGGWSTLTKEELSAYDQYQVIAKAILTMGQDDLDEMRSELEASTREWLDESPDSDRTVKIIRDQLDAKGQVVIAGDPPLTEMSLTAYSEIIAYSMLLRQDPEALPEQISKSTVNDIKRQVREGWEDYSNEEQQQIAVTPGLWFCLRTLVNHGTEKEQEEVRSNIAKLTPETRQTNESNKSVIKDIERKMAIHNSMMGIQRTTYNQYMWSNGFNTLPAAW